MPDIASLAESVLSLVVQAINALFTLLFFWLPDDPFAGNIDNFVFNVMPQYNEPLSWLNWFVEVSYIWSLLDILVVILLAWAAYKLAIHIFSTTSKAIELIPFE